MKKLLIFFLLLTTNLFAEINLVKIKDGLEGPWSLTIVDKGKYLITEKPGNIILFNENNGTSKKIQHDLDVLEDGQGGLLDIFYKDNYVYVTYSEHITNGFTSTSLAKAEYNENQLTFKNLFRSTPSIKSGYHFGSRIVLKDGYIYISSGERGGGIIAQDFTKHPGSIIRVNDDGSIPKDNPKFLDKPNWLPEIYQIGIRNVQGMCLSPFDNEVYMTNHGARGGDWFGRVNKGGNYGWDKLYWGGTKYSGLPGGPEWLPGYDRPIKYYVPSIAASACLIYNGDEFKEWNGEALIASLKHQSLRRLKFKDNEFLNEEVIFKNNIGRIRDVKQQKDGKILMLSDNGELWRMSKK
jgi:quinoprotein glucose dehydrogenase